MVHSRWWRTDEDSHLSPGWKRRCISAQNKFDQEQIKKKKLLFHSKSHRAMIWCCWCQFFWFLKMSRRSCEAPPFPWFNQIWDKSLQRKANQRSVTGGTRLGNEFISLESLVWSCEQNIFLYSSASKSQCNNVFQHNLKWCWRKRRRGKGAEDVSDCPILLMLSWIT